MPVDIHLPPCEFVITLRIGLAHGCSGFFCCQTAALRFQPTKRPQITSQKPKPKASSAKLNPSATITPTQTVVTQDQPSTVTRQPPKTSIADWAGDGDDNDVNGFYGGGEKRQRGGRKKRKKNKEESHAPQNWDDIYDPSRPNSYEEYKNSDEKIREVREWKDRLYAHRMTRQRSDLSDSEDDIHSRPRMSSMSKKYPHISKYPLIGHRSICSPSYVVCSASNS